MLEFTEETHRYEWDGKWVVSVTQALEPLNDYGGIPDWIMRQAAARGTAVHLITEYYDNGMLGDYPDELEPYLAAWEKFLAETEFEIEQVENRVYHPLYQFAGCIDRVGSFPQIKKQPKAILDIKTTAKLMPQAGPQLAAYLEAYNLTNKEEPATQRWVCQLKDDGSYILKQHKDKADLSTFLSCLNITRWKENHQ